MKTNLLKYYVAAFYFCSTFVLFAQPGTDDQGGGLEGDDVPGVPIDDYIWEIGLLGLILAILKLRIMYKNEFQMKE
jgi:hypothetical protein